MPIPPKPDPVTHTTTTSTGGVPPGPGAGEMARPGLWLVESEWEATYDYAAPDFRCGQIQQPVTSVLRMQQNVVVGCCARIDARGGVGGGYYNWGSLDVGTVMHNIDFVHAAGIDLDALWADYLNREQPPAEDEEPSTQTALQANLTPTART